MGDVDTTPVQTERDTVVEVGSRGATFQDLEEMEQSRKDYREAIKNDAKKAARSDKEDKPDSDKKESKSSGKSEAKEGKEKEEKGSSREEKAREEIKKEIKKLKARIGEEEFLDLPTDAKIPHKVAGQDVEVSLNDLLSNYAGKVPWDKKFSEIDVIRKSVEQQKKEMEQTYGKVKELFSNEKSSPIDSLSYILDLAGVSKHDYIRKLRDTIVPDVEAFSQLSQEEKRAYLAEQENKVLREISESDRRRQMQEETRKSLAGRFQQLREAHKLDETDLIRAYNFGLEQQIDVTSPEDVVAVAVELRAVDRAKSVIEEVDPQILTSGKGREILSEIAEIVYKDSSITDEELKEVIAGVFGEEADVRKVKEATAKKIKETSNRKVMEEPKSYASFRDFDD